MGPPAESMTESSDVPPRIFSSAFGQSSRTVSRVGSGELVRRRGEAGLTVPVIYAPRGPEGDCSRELRVRAACHVYVRAERDTELQREQRDAATDTRNQDCLPARDTRIYDDSPKIKIVRPGNIRRGVQSGGRTSMQ
jgi:hypothetical protein